MGERERRWRSKEEAEREREREREEEEEEEESDGQMVKAYLRYEHRLCFGVIACTSSGAKIVEGSGSVLSGGNWSQEKTVLTPALEAVNLWHLRKGVLIKRLVPTDSSSTSATASLGGAGGGGEKPIGKVFELYRVRTAKETIKKAKRRLKREREEQGSGSWGRVGKQQQQRAWKARCWNQPKPV